MVTKWIGGLLWAVLCSGPAAVEEKYGEWEAWNGCGIGSFVEKETVNGSLKFVSTSTLVKKEEKLLTLKVTVKMNLMGKDQEQTQEYTIKKPEATANTPKPEEKKPAPPCDNCKKVHKSENKTSKEKLKIGDKEVECELLEWAIFDCEGKETDRTRTWRSTAVPGGMVKAETKGPSSRGSITVLKFEKK